MFIIWHWEAFVTPASCSRGIPQMTCSAGCFLCLESFLLGRYARLKNRPDKKQDQGLVEYLWCLVWQDLNMWLALLALSCLLPGPYQDSKKIDCFPPIEHRCVLRQITTLCQYLYLLADELAENANARNHEECAQVIAGWWRYGIQDPVAILMILVILDWNDFGKGQKVKNLWFHIKLSYSWEDEPIHQGEKVVTRFWSVAISEGLFFSPVEPRFASSLVQRPWSPPSTSSMRTTKAAGDCFVFFDRNLLGRDRFISLSIDMCHWAVQACVCVCVCHSSSPSLLDAMRSRSLSLPQLQHVSAPGGWSSLIGGVGSAAWLDGTVSAGREWCWWYPKPRRGESSWIIAMAIWLDPSHRPRNYESNGLFAGFVSVSTRVRKSLPKPKGSKAFELLTTAPLGHEAPCLACQPLDQIDIAIFSAFPAFPAKLSCASLWTVQIVQMVQRMSDSCGIPVGFPDILFGHAVAWRFGALARIRDRWARQ